MIFSFDKTSTKREIIGVDFFYFLFLNLVSLQNKKYEETYFYVMEENFEIINISSPLSIDLFIGLLPM